MRLVDWLQNVTDSPEALAEITASEKRIQRAYGELLSGYSVDVDAILNETARVPKYDGFVEVSGIEFISLCGHHFLPFFGQATVRYVPGKIITGLGKIPRVVDALARRFQIQELLTRDIALTVERCIGATGVEVKTSAIHLCMHGRGPRSIGATTTCSYATGCLDSRSRPNQPRRQKPARARRR